MSISLHLTKSAPAAKKGQRQDPDLTAPLWQTPSYISEEARPHLADAWRVFDIYQLWALHGRGAQQYSVEAVEHLDEVRRCLASGYKWSIW